MEIMRAIYVKIIKSILNAISYIIVKNSNDPNSYQWLNKSWYSHTTECYATIKRDDIAIKEMMYISCP